MLDYDDDIRNLVSTRLPHRPSDSTALLSKSTVELLAIYINWRKRFVVPRRRRVHQSWAFSANSLRFDNRYRPGIEYILDALDRGNDLQTNLSRRTEIGFETAPGPSLARRRDLDLLLNEWGIHHFHLSVPVAGETFSRRTQHLLFVAIRPDDAYVIDIGEHSFVEERFLEIAIQDFANSGIVQEARGILGLSNVPTQADRRLLREHGIAQPFFMFRGRVYSVSSDFIASDGSSIQCTRLAQAIHLRLRTWKAAVERDPTLLPNQLREYGIEPPPVLELHFEYTDDGWYWVRESRTNARFEI